jgi:hypothetical protein
MMKELRITLTEEQYEKLKAKLENEGEKNLEHSTTLWILNYAK